MLWFGRTNGLLLQRLVQHQQTPQPGWIRAPLLLLFRSPEPSISSASLLSPPSSPSPSSSSSSSPAAAACLFKTPTTWATVCLALSVRLPPGWWWWWWRGRRGWGRRWRKDRPSGKESFDWWPTPWIKPASVDGSSLFQEQLWWRWRWWSWWQNK